MKDKTLDVIDDLLELVDDLPNVSKLIKSRKPDWEEASHGPFTFEYPLDSEELTKEWLADCMIAYHHHMVINVAKKDAAYLGNCLIISSRILEALDRVTQK